MKRNTVGGAPGGAAPHVDLERLEQLVTRLEAATEAGRGLYQDLKAERALGKEVLAALATLATKFQDNFNQEVEEFNADFDKKCVQALAEYPDLVDGVVERHLEKVFVEMRKQWDEMLKQEREAVANEIMQFTEKRVNQKTDLVMEALAQSKAPPGLRELLADLEGE